MRWWAPAPCSQPEQVQQVHAAGGRLVVAPNFNAEVVREAVRLGMVCLPGVLTATEAFAALAAGATGLKLFPAEMIPPAAVKALRAVLPADTLLLPVGGITHGQHGRLPRGGRRRLRHRLGALPSRDWTARRSASGRATSWPPARVPCGHDSDVVVVDGGRRPQLHRSGVIPTPFVSEKPSAYRAATVRRASGTCRPAEAAKTGVRTYIALCMNEFFLALATLVLLGVLFGWYRWLQHRRRHRQRMWQAEGYRLIHALNSYSAWLDFLRASP